MIQNTNFTYNGLLNILNSFAESHIDVRRFVAEDVDQMSEITSKEELFPMMFVAPINNIYDWQINQYEIRVYVYDRILKDRSNINDIRSKTNQILNDLDVWLRKESQLPIEVTNISIAYPFSSELMTDVTGWYFDVVIDIPSYETCKIPFLTSPLITGFTCDVVYTNDYLTCSDLIDCPTIQEIQNDIINIENQLSGLTPDNFYTTGATLSGTTIIFDRNDLLNAYSVDISPALPNPFDCNDLSGCTIIQTIQQDLNNKVPYTGATSNVQLGEFGVDTGFVQFDLTPTQSGGIGKLNWNDTDGTLDLGLKGGNVTLQLGQEQIIRVVNKTNSNLLESQYKVVRVRTQSEGGAQGQRLAVVLAQANTKANHSGVLGIVTENIANNQEGFITTFGNVRGINTTGSLQGETWSDGDVLWLSETNAGGLTNIEPQNHPVQIGYVVYAHNNQGKIFVKVEDGVDELSELHDVQFTGTTKGGSSLTYNTSTGIWEDKPITWTVELIDALTVDVYAPYNLSIDTIINVLNSPSITIQDDGMSYTLGNTISVGSKITITASSIGVINLIINKL